MYIDGTMLAQIILSEMEKALPSIGTACPEEDKYKDKGTHTQIKTNTKCFQDPMHSGLKQGVRWGVAKIWLQTQF